mmetsp:Transcript_97278/g.275621  ORF Transcript_97278/g.275621 Transcript_97278/m.275621 type:complete len:402 (+) Transcript_97278:297-1502(+)
MDVAAKHDDLPAVDRRLPREAEVQQPQELADLVGPVVLQEGNLFGLLANDVRGVAHEGDLRANEHAHEPVLPEGLSDGGALLVAEDGPLLLHAVGPDAVPPHVDHEDAAGAVAVEVPLLHLRTGLQLLLGGDALGVPELALVHPVDAHAHTEEGGRVGLGPVLVLQDGEVVGDVVVAPDHEVRRSSERGRGAAPVPGVAVGFLQLRHRIVHDLLSDAGGRRGLELDHLHGAGREAVRPGVHLVAEVQHHVALPRPTYIGHGVPGVLLPPGEPLGPVAAHGDDAQALEIFAARGRPHNAADLLQPFVGNDRQRVEGDAVLGAGLQAPQLEDARHRPAQAKRCRDSAAAAGGRGRAHNHRILINLEQDMRGAVGRYRAHDWAAHHEHVLRLRADRLDISVGLA